MPLFCERISLNLGSCVQNLMFLFNYKGVSSKGLQKN